MSELPVVVQEHTSAGQAGLDRLLDILLTLTVSEAMDGLEQVEAVLTTVCRLQYLRILPPDDPDAGAEAGRPVMVLRGDNGVRFHAWPPERLAEPDVQAALHLAARFVPRLHRAPSPPPDGPDADWSRYGGLVGRSEAMLCLHERIARVARRSFSVLIEGESGVGKELVARHVHSLSARRRGPFVAVNCAAIVETLLEAELFGIEERTATGVRGRRGKFELADGGTLFLDEVSDLSSAAQAKLLRAIQDLAVERVGSHGMRRLNVRIIAATNRPLGGATMTGQFRRDLYYRLNAVEIAVPPLRARREDIPLLASTFLRRFGEGQAYRLSARALDALLVHEWPGNVRELERVIERAVTLASGEFLDIDDLPESVTGRYREVMAHPPGDTDHSMRAWGARYARMVLARTRGNKREACRVLDISYHTLQSYLTYGASAVQDGAGPTPITNEGTGAPAPEHLYPPPLGHGAAVVHEAPSPTWPREG